MLNREDVERMIDQKIEPLTEDIAALKAQFGKVDLLAIDNRNIRQSLGRLETAQTSLKTDFERQEKRLIRFENQTNEQFAGIKGDIVVLKEDVATVKGDITVMKEDITTIKEQLNLTVTLLRRALPPEEQR